MRPNHPILPAGLMVLGLIAMIFSASSLIEKDGFASSDNPFALKRSAYGRLLARLSETTVDRIWHLGVEQIVPHYMSGETHTETEVAENSTPEESGNEVKEDRPRGPIIQEAKRWVQKRVVSQYTRTNPYGMSEKHLIDINLDIADMLKRSYDLDPTHYGAYNAYNLFVTHQTFGGSDKGRDVARRLAEETIAIVEEEDEDPEAFITAASASMNLFILETEDARINKTPIELDVLKKFRDQTSYLLGRFEELQEKAEDAGTWEYVSTDRQVEMIQRYRFTKKISSQFDAMIARAEGKELNLTEPEAEMAENLD